ncbi:hypothetical protein ACFVS2_25885 [Brevibacillus sp. NPDC058079]|uniref:hypothetical protein n=1 Tax=Brevibacillus sp. NPDC058079 TaxID=3346330 RepID=UPI0036E8DE0F
MIPKKMDFFTFALKYKKREVSVLGISQNVIGDSYLKLADNDLQEYTCKINPQGFLKFAESKGYTKLVDLANRFLEEIEENKEIKKGYSI